MDKVKDITEILTLKKSCIYFGTSSNEMRLDKVKDITEILTLKKAVYILERLQMKCDYEYMKKNPDICKSIVVLFEDDFESI